MEILLQVRDARYCYNGKQVLTIPALDISRATITGLAGPNGSGKTTLLKLLSSIVKPTSGSVCLVGDNASAKDGTNRHRLCLLPQETYLLKRTVFENVAYGLRIRGKKEGFQKVIADALELVGLPQSFADRLWHELSGGEAQRVALAARLVLKPDCLLLDEPTVSVDMESARSIRRAVLLARREWGTTLIIASHHRSWLNDICDRIIYLYNGRILNCSYENILTGPWERVDNTMVACKLSDGQRVYAVKPPTTENNAVIAPEALQVNSPLSGSNIESFQGIVTSVIQDSHTAAPQVYVSCGDQRILVNISAESLAMENFRPGQQVTLHYNPEEIIWLEK